LIDQLAWPVAKDALQTAIGPSHDSTSHLEDADEIDVEQILLFVGRQLQFRVCVREIDTAPGQLLIVSGACVGV